MRHFLIKQDFYAIATQEDLDLLIDENIRIMQKCIQIAQDEAAGYLSVKYDIDKIMPNIKIFSDEEGVEYVEGDLFAIPESEFNDIYTVTSKKWIPFDDDPTPDFESNTIMEDPRNQKLVEVVCTIALYHMHKRLSPNNIPDFRKKEYDGDGDAYIMSAIKWLMLVRNGDITPDGWKLRTSEEEFEKETGKEPMFDIDGDDASEGMMWGGSNLYEYSLNGYEWNRNVHLHIPKQEEEEIEEEESGEEDYPQVPDGGWVIPIDPQPIP